MPSPTSPSDPNPGTGPPPTLRILLASHLPLLETIVRRRMPGPLRDKESATDVVDSICGDLLTDESRFVYQGAREFRRFLDTVVVNKLRERLRFHRRQRRGNGRALPATDAELAGTTGDQRSPSQVAILRERFDLARRALERLPAHCREVILRTRILGESYAQVAASMQRTVPSLRNLLHRALAKLGVEMDRLLNGDGAGAGPPRQP
jgi:RNA polymerase sigma-70 factor (ECF subfamily)